MTHVLFLLILTPISRIEFSLIPDMYHCTSFHDLFFSFFTPFPSPLPNFLTFIPHFTHSQPKTRQQDTMILVQNGLAINDGL